VPRDTGPTFDPQIVGKRQRQLTRVDEIVLSLIAKGLTTGEIAAHFTEMIGARVSKPTISRITEKVIREMTEWQNRLDAIREGSGRAGHEPAGLRSDRCHRQR
jgi:transposase-like protein